MPYDYFRISETHSTRKVTWVRDKNKRVGSGPAWHSAAVFAPVLQEKGCLHLPSGSSEAREFLRSPVVKTSQVDDAPSGPWCRERIRGEKEEIVSPTVLIVDEDVNAQIIAETLLRLRDLGVRLARDGTEACDIMSHGDIAVVVLDVSVPGMNGFEVLRRLRGRLKPLPLATKPRILVVTDRHEPEVERFAFRLGADAVLRKPLPPAEFVKTVQQLVEGAAPEAA